MYWLIFDATVDVFKQNRKIYLPPKQSIVFQVHISKAFGIFVKASVPYYFVFCAAFWELCFLIQLKNSLVIDTFNKWCFLVSEMVSGFPVIPSCVVPIRRGAFHLVSMETNSFISGEFN